MEEDGEKEGLLNNRQSMNEHNLQDKPNVLRFFVVIDNVLAEIYKKKTFQNIKN